MTRGYLGSTPDGGIDDADREPVPVVSNQRVMPMMTGQSQSGPAIPWYLAEIVYEGYAALYGRSQTVERMAERGGFGWGEVAIIFRELEKRDRTLWAALLTRAAAGIPVETTTERCGWFGEGRGQCLLREGHRDDHTCEHDGRQLRIALLGLAAVSEAERRVAKATCGWGGAYGRCVLEPGHDGMHDIPPQVKTSDHGATSAGAKHE